MYSLTLALDGGEWLASRFGRFSPRERDPGTHWTGGLVGPRSILDTVVFVKNVLTFSVTLFYIPNMST
jgi:hypothetical protein